MSELTAAVKTTAFDLQFNPAAFGRGFYEPDRARGKNYVSVRIRCPWLVL